MTERWVNTCERIYNEWINERQVNELTNDWTNEQTMSEQMNKQMMSEQQTMIEQTISEWTNNDG